MNPKRKELLEALAKLSEADPDLRLGQMIINLVNFADTPHDETVWNVEDDTLITAARELTEIHRRRHQAVA